jgi:hypothetical protein
MVCVFKSQHTGLCFPPGLFLPTNSSHSPYFIEWLLFFPSFDCTIFPFWDTPVLFLYPIDFDNSCLLASFWSRRNLYWIQMTQALEI